MWLLLLRRDPKPDATYWLGRRWLAALDAVAWPAGAFALVWQWLPVGSLSGAVPGAFCVIAAVLRLHRAIWRNHRYRFTTWRWGRIGLVLTCFGLLLRWLVSL